MVKQQIVNLKSEGSSPSSTASSKRKVGERMRPTRQSCGQCHKRMSIDYYSPFWDKVVHPNRRNDILCLDCFAEMGDERNVAWEAGLRFLTITSLRSQHDFQAEQETSSG